MAQEKNLAFLSDSRVFFLCPCGAEGKTSCLSFRFLAPFFRLFSPILLEWEETSGKKGEFFPLPGPFSERKRTGFPRTPKDFIPSAPQGQRKKKRKSGEISEEEKVSKSEERPSPQIPLESEGTRNRKNGRPLRFQRNLRGPGVEKKGRISPDSWLFFPVGKKGRIFYYSKGIVKSIGVGENIRKRTGFHRLLRSRGKYRKRKKFALFPRLFPPIPKEWEETSGEKGARNRRKTRFFLEESKIFDLAFLEKKT